MNMIMDVDGKDQFGFKNDIQFHIGIGILVILLIINTSIVTKIMRRCFCLKTKYILVEKKNA